MLPAFRYYRLVEMLADWSLVRLAMGVVALQRHLAAQTCLLLAVVSSRLSRDDVESSKSGKNW